MSMLSCWRRCGFSYALCLCFSQLSREEQASLEGNSFSAGNLLLVEPVSL